MNFTVVAIRATLAFLVVGVMLVLIGLVFPSKAFAAEVMVQTAQLLPPGSNTCEQLSVSGFTPYVYDGALHAFEFSVTDSSYVAIVGSAGNTSIPFNQMTRRMEPSGTLRIHADIAATPIRGSLTIRATMLSAKGPGQPVCISIISTTLGAGNALQATPAPAPAPTPSTGPSVSKPRPSESAGTSAGAVTPSPSSGKAATSTKTAPAATAQNVLKDICAAGGASRMWFVLLAVYAVIVAAAVFGQPQMPPSMRSQEWVAGAIVVPFLLLFGLWYFVESCRISAWVPAIATLIALAGLAVAFWDTTKKSTPVINLPGAKT